MVADGGQPKPPHQEVGVLPEYEMRGVIKDYHYETFN